MRGGIISDLECEGAGRDSRDDLLLRCPSSLEERSVWVELEFERLSLEPEPDCEPQFEQCSHCDPSRERDCEVERRDFLSLKAEGGGISVCRRRGLRSADEGGLESPLSKESFEVTARRSVQGAGGRSLSTAAGGSATGASALTSISSRCPFLRLNHHWPEDLASTLMVSVSEASMFPAGEVRAGRR